MPWYCLLLIISLGLYSSNRFPSIGQTHVYVSKFALFSHFKKTVTLFLSVFRSSGETHSCKICPLSVTAYETQAGSSSISSAWFRLQSLPNKFYYPAPILMPSYSSSFFHRDFFLLISLPCHVSYAVFFFFFYLEFFFLILLSCPCS